MIYNRFSCFYFNFLINYVFKLFKNSNILNDNTIQEYHLSQRFIIVVIVDEVQRNTNSLNEIFELLWKNGLINAHILIQNEPKFWTLYTFMPYQEDCSNLGAMKIESFTPFNYTENMTVPEDQLFPKKLNDFNRCPLKIATSLVDPFVILYNTSDAKHRYSGIDINAVTGISKLLNFVAVYTKSSDGTGHGIIFSNKSVTGNLKLVHILDISIFSYFILSI